MWCIGVLISVGVVRMCVPDSCGRARRAVASPREGSRVVARASQVQPGGSDLVNKVRKTPSSNY